MGRLEACHSTAFLIDQNRRISPTHRVPERRGQRGNLFGRVTIIVEENKAQRVGVLEEKPFVLGKRESATAKDNRARQRPIRV